MNLFKKVLKFFLLFLGILGEIFVILVIAYTIFDNNHINVVRQTVRIKGLAPQFEGFTMLQLSDLHGKSFGKSQQELTGIINSLDYDAVLITGDMQDTRSKDTQPFLELLQGITKDTPIFYIGGNTGPFDITISTMWVKRQFSLDMATGEILPFGQELESRGVSLLNEPKSVERNGSLLWFVPDFSFNQSAYMVQQARQELQGIRSPQEISDPAGLIEYQETLQAIYSSFKPADNLIGIFHIPLSHKQLLDPTDLAPYDLVIAGHYHGGQIRVPYYGALYISDETLPEAGFLPPQDLVSGLFSGNGIQQYVSRGLGASSRIPLLTFRLFDTPEINLIRIEGSP